MLGVYLIDDGHTVMRMVTFGQPRFMTAKCVSQLAQIPLTRVVDESDIIAFLPPDVAIDKVHRPYEHVA
jgi:hypothetical protein